MPPPPQWWGWGSGCTLGQCGTRVSVRERIGGARLCSPYHSFIMPVSSALFLSRLESRDVVCTDEEHIRVAFADALGGETSQAALDTRAQMVDEKPANEHKKVNLGPNPSLFLLRQRPSRR